MKSRTVARLGIIAAVIIAAYFLDAAISRFVPVFGHFIRHAATTLIVTLTISQLFDFKTAVFATTVFGCISFVTAYLMPVITSVAFQKPHISILPRMIIGMVSYGLYRGLSKAFKDNGNKFLRDVFPSAAAAGAGVLTNTLIVVTLLIIEGLDMLGQAMIVGLSITVVVEFLCGILVVPMLVRRLRDNPSVKAIR